MLVTCQVRDRQELELSETVLCAVLGLTGLGIQTPYRQLGGPAVALQLCSYAHRTLMRLRSKPVFRDNNSSRLSHDSRGKVDL